MVAIAENSLKPETTLTNQITLAKSGNQAAFAELVDTYQKGIFMLAYGYFMNKDDALEIVQETFLAAFKSLKKLKDDSRFESWLYMIARNKCHSHFRKKKRIVQLDEMHENSREHASDNDFFTTNKRGDDVKKAINELPQQQKTIVIMKYVQNMKLREIAEKLDISLGTVKKHHFRAINKLKEKTGTISEDSI